VNVVQQTVAAISLGGAVVGGGVAGAALAAALPASLEGSALATALSPFGGLFPEVSVGVGFNFAGAAAEAAVNSGVIAAADIGGVVGIVATALVIAVMRGISVADTAALPSKLNQLLEAAQTGGPGDASAAAAT